MTEGEKRIAGKEETMRTLGRATLALLLLSTVASCDSSEKKSVADVGDVAADERNSADVSAPTSCFGAEPAAVVGPLPWRAPGTSNSSFIEEHCPISPWARPSSLATLPSGGLAVAGSLHMCCTDTAGSALTGYDATGTPLWTAHDVHGRWGGTALAGKYAWVADWNGGLIAGRSQSKGMMLAGLFASGKEEWTVDSEQMGLPWRLMPVGGDVSDQFRLLAEHSSDSDSGVKKHWLGLVRIGPGGVLAGHVELPGVEGVALSWRETGEDIEVIASATSRFDALPSKGWNIDEGMTADIRFVRLGWDGTVKLSTEIGEWSTQPEVGQVWAYASAVEPEGSGWLIVVESHTFVPDEEQIRYSLVRLDGDGKKVWEGEVEHETLGIGFPGFGLRAAWLRPDATLSAWTTPTMNGQVGDAPARAEVRLADDGTVVEVTPALTDPTGSGKPWQVEQVLQLPDGFLAVGEVPEGDEQTFTCCGMNLDTVAARYRFDGSVVWAKAYGIAGRDEVAGLLRTGEDLTLLVMREAGETVCDGVYSHPLGPVVLRFHGVCE